ncbi:MAG: 30S ribosomal protein S4 [Chlamydiia bacterium]|nr:30S ribosomal protein S4 [Chlamydiia bacterium]
MARYTGPKNRIARKFGCNIFGRSRNPLLHKQHPPGMHGARRKKSSDYGLQLAEKQKLVAAFGMISLSQLLKYYRNAVRLNESTPTALMRQLECRLDVFVYRSGFASTIFQAQQLVSHGHVQVNGKKLDIRSYQVKVGDAVSIRPKSQNLKIVTDAITQSSANETPEYMTVDHKGFKSTLECQPEVDNIPLPCPIKISSVCEFLAHTT